MPNKRSEANRKCDLARLTSQPLYSYRDEAYVFDVKLGTPTQTLRLSFDLTRSGIAVAGASCKSCAGASKAAYEGTKSSTSSCKRDGKTIGDATAVECLDAIEVALPDCLNTVQRFIRDRGHIFSQNLNFLQA